MPVSARTFLKVHQSAWRVIGPSPLALGQSQRRLACAFHSRRNSARTGSGSGTERSLLPLPTTRISPFLPSIEVTSRVAASLMRRPQAYISRNAILATGCRTLPTTARASASERTPGRRLRFGALTFFLRTAPSRSRACVCRETGCQHDRAGTFVARRPARRAVAKSSCAPPSRRDRRASGDSGRQGRERRGCRRPGYLARGRPRPCRRSYAYAGVSSRWSFWQVDRHMPAPRDYPTHPSHDLTASAIYGEAVQSNENYGEWPAFLALIVAKGRPRGLASFRGLSGSAMPWGTTIPCVRLATDLIPLAVLSLLFQVHERHVHCRTADTAACRDATLSRTAHQFGSDNQAQRTGPPSRACARTGRKIPRHDAQARSSLLLESGRTAAGIER